MVVRRLIAIAVFLTLTLVVASASLNASRPVALTEPPASRIGCASYAPYRLAGESPFDPDHVVSPARIAQDLGLLAGLTRCVRTYSTQQGLGAVPKVAQQLGMTVLLGIWIGRDPQANEIEIAAGIELARQFPDTVKAVIVGNEVLLRREQTASTMAEYLARVGAAVATPVTYADVWEFWLQNRSLAGQVDYVTAHILPFWEDHPVAIEQAVQHVTTVFREVQAVFPDKRVMIGETGWPSEGRMRGPALPGPLEQARFMREWVAAAIQQGIDYNVIEAFDQPWKRRLEGAMGGHWGLLDSAGEQKFPWQGPMVERPGRFQAALIGMLVMSLAAVLLLDFDAASVEPSRTGRPTPADPRRLARQCGRLRGRDVARAASLPDDLESVCG